MGEGACPNGSCRACAGSGSRSAFAWGPGLERQGVDALARDVAQRGVDHALALQARCSGERGALDLDGEVRFAAAVIARVAVVAGAVVDDIEVSGSEGIGEKPSHFLSNWSVHAFHLRQVSPIWKPVSMDRFHGRFEATGRICNWPGCDDAGEFRAPGPRASGFDGPGDYRWFCLDHVRQFNSGYDYFDGMSSEEIFEAQSPLHGWANTTRAFQPDAGVDAAPRWADFADPLEAINARARAHVRERRQHMRSEAGRFTPAEQHALSALNLEPDIDRTALRRRYTELVRRFHPDHNGGDRTHEERLQQVVSAYQLLRKAPVFA